MAHIEGNTKEFITRYNFEKDRSRPGRSLQSVKIGGVYISRVVIDPYGRIGNIYYKKTNIIFFVETGRVKMKCLQVNTKEEKEVVISPGDSIIHLPPHIAYGVKNLEKEEAVLILLSNRALRSDDEYPYDIYSI